jgi:hypothetical protein
VSHRVAIRKEAKKMMSHLGKPDENNITELAEYMASKIVYSNDPAANDLYLGMVYQGSRRRGHESLLVELLEVVESTTKGEDEKLGEVSLLLEEKMNWRPMQLIRTDA